MSIEKTIFDGIDAVKLSMDKYEVTVLTGRGCNIIDFKVFDDNDVLHILHVPTALDQEEFERSPQRFGSVVLFPPNRIADGIYDWDGQTYDLSGHNIPFAHGILKEFPYEVVRIREEENLAYLECRLSSSDTPYMSAFNWEFDVYFEFELSQKGLSQKITIRNMGHENIPFGIGYHTAFLIPQSSRYTRDDYSISVCCDMQWETDEHMIPSGRLIPLRLPYDTGVTAPLSTVLNDHLRARLAENGLHRAVVTNLQSKHKFIYETDKAFGNWMIWNNNACCDYVCIEPMTCIIDAPHSSLTREEHGFMSLRADQSFSAVINFYYQ